MNEPQTSMSPNEPGKISPWLLIALGVVVLAAIVFFGWYFMNQNKVTPVATSSVVPTTITSPTISPSISTSPISTADWKTYTDSANTFSFKYPSNYSVKSVGGDTNVGGNDFQLCIDTNLPTAGKVLFCQDDSGMSTTIANNPKNLSLDAFVKEVQSKQVGTIYKNEPVQVAGQTGIKSVQTSVCDGVGCDYGTYYLQKDSAVAIISYSPSPRSESDRVYSTILSTFQFTK